MGVCASIHRSSRPGARHPRTQPEQICSGNPAPTRVECPRCSMSCPAFHVRSRPMLDSRASVPGSARRRRVPARVCAADAQNAFRHLAAFIKSLFRAIRYVALPAGAKQRLVVGAARFRGAASPRSSEKRSKRGRQRRLTCAIARSEGSTHARVQYRAAAAEDDKSARTPEEAGPAHAHENCAAMVHVVVSDRHVAVRHAGVLAAANMRRKAFNRQVRGAL